MGGVSVWEDCRMASVHFIVLTAAALKVTEKEVVASHGTAV
jgi:hypothetical protein